MTWDDIVANCEGFEWDEHNTFKSWRKHLVTPQECEELFFNRPLVIAADERHSDVEDRFFALGITDASRRLFAVFTVRKKLIRLISVRDMSRKERKEFEIYEKTEKHS